MPFPLALVVSIGALREEVEIGTNVKLNPLYIAERRDEIQYLQCTTRIIQSILNWEVVETLNVF
jgi:hypothetical protein